MTQLTVQLIVSALIVVAVLWFMWKLPKEREYLFGWAPPLSLISAWGGLLALAGSALLWLLPYPDRWVVFFFLLLDPAAIASGILVKWIYRGHEDTKETIDLQLLQARVGITLGLIAVLVGYIFVMTHKPPMTPTGV